MYLCMLRPSGNQKQNKVKIGSRRDIATKSPSAVFAICWDIPEEEEVFVPFGHIYGNMNIERQEALHVTNESELVNFHPTVVRLKRP